MIAPVRWEDGGLVLLDQTKLPTEEVERAYTSWPDVADAIRTLVVRGAPAIGVAAAFGVVLAARASRATTHAALLADLEEAIKGLAATRPTAVNLFWALDRMRRVVVADADVPPARLRDRLLDEAQAILSEDLAANRAMGAHGATLVPDGARLLTHCNAGALATAGYGTALGVIRAAHERGKLAMVWVDETRPVMQGSRLTAWELVKEGIPHRLISDVAAGFVMKRGEVDLVVTGADRIAANGDTANKIGTYSVAVLARHHGIPFYVAAPSSTIDPSIPSGDTIVIEERDAAEVRGVAGRQTAPAASPVFNPAFDVTPAALISAIITERGVFRPPSARSPRRGRASPPTATPPAPAGITTAPRTRPSRCARAATCSTGRPSRCPSRSIPPSSRSGSRPISPRWPSTRSPRSRPPIRTRPRRRSISSAWPGSSSSPRASPGSRRTRAARRSTSAPPPPPARSTRPRCTWWPARSRGSIPVSIISVRATSA